MKAAFGLVLATALVATIGLSEDLPTATSTRFAGSGRCESCHSASTSETGPMRASDGSDISPITLWRSSVMANAAKDPVWQAKVAAEVAVHPSIQSIIEDKCTTCHTPMARTEAIAGGANAYSLAEALTDPLAMDGVSCTLCHQIQSDNLGTGGSFSGGYTVDAGRVIFGPYDNVLSTVMESAVNYAAAQGLHVTGSELCATCHTLFTPTIDNTGQIVGQIAEQTPYFEWLNSVYPAQGIECQTCHMPEVEEPTEISTVPNGLPKRSPFSKHYFVGGNTMLLDMMKQAEAEIGVAADTDEIDSTLARTRRQLRRQTADLDATYAWPHPDTLEVTLTVHNKTGHKLPTGFPSRRLWLNVQLSTDTGVTVFESGGWNADLADIDHLDEPFEPHHDVIRTEQAVAVYQSLMADVDGELTWTLLRGASYLKDNRIPPEGFTTEGAAYDSMKIVGLAAVDENFNRSGSSEGTGADRVIYRIGGLTQSTPYTFSARLLYQALSRGFVDDLAQYPGQAVADFNTYYSRIDETPVTVDSLGISITSTGTESDDQIPGLSLELYPNPATDVVWFLISDPQGAVQVVVYDLVGREVATLTADATPGVRSQLRWITADVADGLYVFRVSAGRRSTSGKIMLVR